MGKRDLPDAQIQGQMDINDLFRPPERLFAVSRIFARARKEMNLAEQKTFVYALSQLKFTEEAKTNYIKLEKKTLAQILDMKSDPDHLSVDLYNMIKDLPKHSYIEINEKDLDFQSSGFIITAVTRFKNIIRLRFNEEYMGLFTGLSTDYITMWSKDIFRMTTRRSVQFYELLRQETDTRLEINDLLYGIRAFKAMFDIPETGEGSYMRKDNHFDRASFERYVIHPLCDDLKHCEMIKLLLQPDGKPYEKVKVGNRVIGYRFRWIFNARPKPSNLQKKEDTTAIPEHATAEKKPSKKPNKKNQFNNFPQRNYDEEFYRQLEAMQGKK